MIETRRTGDGLQTLPACFTVAGQPDVDTASAQAMVIEKHFGRARQRDAATNVQY
jgi:hypothetical protein